jgi:hypothetical protein
MNRCRSTESLTHRLLTPARLLFWAGTGRDRGTCPPMRVRVECPLPKEFDLHSRLHVLKLAFHVVTVRGSKCAADP